MTTAPVVSVIIPIYNNRRYLAESIESALNQTYDNTELIVVDDGSTDDGGQLARAYVPRLHYVHQLNGGTGAARNRGTDEASGDFFAFLDADDLWPSDRLSSQMAVFESNPVVELVTGQVKQFISPELDVETRRSIYCPEEPLSAIFVGTVLIRREAFIRVGPFNPDLQVSENLDWVFRVKEHQLNHVSLPQVVQFRRLHDANKGVTMRDVRIEYVRTLKALLDRRRGEN